MSAHQSAVLALLGGQVSVLAQAASLDDVLDNLRNVIMGLAAGIATLYLTYGGVLYMTAGGDAGQVERAKGALRSAAIGYGVAVLAPVLLTLLNQIVGA